MRQILRLARFICAKTADPELLCWIKFFSVPLVEKQQVYGFMVCGKVRVKYQEYKIIDFVNIAPWENDAALKMHGGVSK